MVAENCLECSRREDEWVNSFESPMETGLKEFFKNTFNLMNVVK